MKQLGGSFTVNGWLALLLLAAGIASAATSVYLSYHRTIDIHYSEPLAPTIHISTVSTEPVPMDSDADLYSTHIFPSGRDVCDFADTICWIKI